MNNFKKVLFLCFLFPSIVFAQSAKFFTQGKVDISDAIETIPLQYVNHMPIVKVKIKDQFYNFIFDTGAPTVISSKIFDLLGIDPNMSKKITDSQSAAQKQIFTVLPQMQIGAINYTNIGCVVIDFRDPEFTCNKIDGIFGANQMEKLFWRINFKDKAIEASKSISNFNLKDYTAKIKFKTKDQKTPIVSLKLFGDSYNLTFDTGYTGILQIKNSNNAIENKMSPKDIFEGEGSNSVGIFGAGEKKKIEIARIPSVIIDNFDFGKSQLTSGNSNLIGNKFFENYSIILDWKNDNLYFKKVDDKPQEETTFGFGYRFVDNKALIVQIEKKEITNLRLGDEILSINGTSLENLDSDEACNYYKNRIETGKENLDLKIKRDNSVLNLKVVKHPFFQN